MRIIAISLAALVLATPALAQRAASRIVGRASTTAARTGTMVDSGGRQVDNYNSGRERANVARTQYIGVDRDYQTEADLIYRYDTSDSALKAAKDALDRARTAFINHCVDIAGTPLSACEGFAREMETNRIFVPDGNPLRDDLHHAALHLQRVQAEYDKVRVDMGVVGDAVRAEIDEGLKNFRSAYNRARAMCNDNGALEAIKSANNFVAATLALQGIGAVGGMIAHGAGEVGIEHCGAEPLPSVICTRPFNKDNKNPPKNMMNESRTGCPTYDLKHQEYMECTEGRNKNTGMAQRRTGNLIGAAGNVGATITSLVARDAFMKAIYRLDDCQNAAMKIFDAMKVTECPHGFNAETADDGTGKMVATGKCVADSLVTRNCPFGWTFDAATDVCVTTAENLAGQTVPNPTCPIGSTLIASGVDAGMCRPLTVDKANVTGITKGIDRIWQGSKAKDSVEACLDVRTGTGKFGNQQSDRWQLAWMQYVKGNGLSLQVMADNMLYSALGSGVSAAISVGGVMGSKGGGASAVIGSLSAVGFTVPVLLASSEMLYRAEKCLSGWPETADEQW